MTRVLLVLLIHLEADPLDAALLHFVLITAVLTGGQRRGLTGLVDRRLPTLPLELRGLRDRRQEAKRRQKQRVKIQMRYENTFNQTWLKLM